VKDNTAPYRGTKGLSWPANWDFSTPATNVQRALRALEQREVVAGERGAYRIVEPFLADWLRRR
jgi:hypothetical protein